MREPERSAWLAQLTRSKVEWLVIYLPSPSQAQRSTVFRWTRSLPRRFELTHSSERMRIYRFDAGSD